MQDSLPQAGPKRLKRGLHWQLYPHVQVQLYNISAILPTLHVLKSRLPLLPYPGVHYLSQHLDVGCYQGDAQEEISFGHHML